jgi:NADPH-dependent curcumin reductase CurA
MKTWKNYKITKKAIKEAFQSEKQFVYHLNYYCSDFNDVLILACRRVEPKQTLQETINYIYDNIGCIIMDAKFHLDIVREYLD